MYKKNGVGSFVSWLNAMYDIAALRVKKIVSVIGSVFFLSVDASTERNACAEQKSLGLNDEEWGSSSCD